MWGKPRYQSKGQRTEDDRAYQTVRLQIVACKVLGLKRGHSKSARGGTARRKLWIPVHPALAKVLEACDQDGVTILQTTFGQPFTGNGLGNFMADKIATFDLRPLHRFPTRFQRLGIPSEKPQSFKAPRTRVVEPRRIELLTSAVRLQRSPI
jgi:hypothetical protein